MTPESIERQWGGWLDSRCRCAPASVRALVREAVDRNGWMWQSATDTRVVLDRFDPDDHSTDRLTLWHTGRRFTSWDRRIIRETARGRRVADAEAIIRQEHRS